MCDRHNITTSYNSIHNINYKYLLLTWNWILNKWILVLNRINAINSNQLVYAHLYESENKIKFGDSKSKNAPINLENFVNTCLCSHKNRNTIDFGSERQRGQPKWQHRTRITLHPCLIHNVIWCLCSCIVARDTYQIQCAEKRPSVERMRHRGRPPHRTHSHILY